MRNNIKFVVFDEILLKEFHVEEMLWNYPCPKGEINPKYIRLRGHPEIHVFKKIRMDMKQSFERFTITQVKEKPAE